MKIIFFGSDEFAAKNLVALSASEHEVIALITQPDRARGRGMKVDASLIKQSAQSNGIPVYQPVGLRDQKLLQELKDLNPDLFVVIAYGKILPPEILQLPYVCAINVHASLLPKYRGAAPINWAIINGEKETGLSLIKMNADLDAGDVFVQQKIKIDKDDTAQTLRIKLAEMSYDLLLKTINSLEKNEYTLTAQDNQAATYAPKLTKELGKIDWQRSAAEIHDLVRGLLPWPAAYTSCQGKQLKILASEVVALNYDKEIAGTVVEITQQGFVVATGNDALLILEVHPESSKTMSAKSFLAGHKIEPGTRLGEEVA